MIENLLTNFLQPIGSLVTQGQNLHRVKIFIRIMIHTKIEASKNTPKPKNQLHITTITTTIIIMMTITTTIIIMKNITTTNLTEEPR